MSGRRTRKDILEERLTADQLKAVYLLLDNEIKAEGERMSQDDIARECNVNRSTLYRWRTQNQDFIDYRREVTRNYISDMSGLFIEALRKSIIGTNGVPSMKALDLFAKMEGHVQSGNTVDVNIGSGGRSDDDLESELEKLDEQLKSIEKLDESLNDLEGTE